MALREKNECGCTHGCKRIIHTINCSLYLDWSSWGNDHATCLTEYAGIDDVRDFRNPYASVCISVCILYHWFRLPLVQCFDSDEPYRQENGFKEECRPIGGIFAIFGVLAILHWGVRFYFRKMGTRTASSANVFVVTFLNCSSVTQLLSWGGMIFTTLVVFILPLLLSLYTLEEAHEQGSVTIYGRWNLTSKKSQTIALRVLLVLAVLSTFAALLGNIVDKFEDGPQ
jgi:hypothetical protein